MIGLLIRNHVLRVQVSTNVTSLEAKLKVIRLNGSRYFFTAQSFLLFCLFKIKIREGQLEIYTD
jgi:hypothetical protein